MITSQYLTEKTEQVLELINGNDCDKVFFIRKDKLNRIPYRSIPGVYILFDKDEIVYIGSTVNLFQRVLTHKKAIPYQKKMTKPMKWEGALCIAMNVDRDVYFKKEQKLIEFFKPKYNRQYMNDENKKVFINQDIQIEKNPNKSAIDINIHIHFTNSIANQGYTFTETLNKYLEHFEDKQIRIRIKKKCLEWFDNNELLIN
jgi:predicted GIY-YIG superfamily endonuclease